MSALGVYVQGFVFGLVGYGSDFGDVLVLAPTGGAGLRWTALPYRGEAGVIGTVAITTCLLLTAALMRTRQRALPCGLRLGPSSNKASDGCLGSPGRHLLCMAPSPTQHKPCHASTVVRRPWPFSGLDRL